MATAPPQTALARDFPSVAGLSRQELEGLLGSASRPGAGAPWYLAQQPAQGSRQAPTAAPPSAPPAEELPFEAFIDSLPEVQALREESKRLLQLSEDKAAQNATLQPDLEGLRAETQRLYDRARSLEAQWPQTQAAMTEAYKRFSPSALYFSLTQSASKLHDESESLASAFAEGLPLDVASTGSLAAASSSALALPGITPPESGAATPTRNSIAGESTAGTSASTSSSQDAAFVRRYRAVRMTYHRRNLMAERWARGAVTWRDD